MEILPEIHRKVIEVFSKMPDLRKFYNEWCALIRKRLADPET